MQKQLSQETIEEKFQMLIGMDSEHMEYLEKQWKLQTSNKVAQNMHNISKGKALSKNKSAEKARKKAEEVEQKSKNEFIFTKGDIIKEISKLKPYLKEEQEELNTVEIENYENKKIPAEEKKDLSNVIIYLNKQLCEKLREQATLEKQLKTVRQCKEQEGWIYEIFYRMKEEPSSASPLLSSNSIASEPSLQGPSVNAAHEGNPLSSMEFRNGYVVMTSVIELYQNLTFDKCILTFNVSEVNRVKYLEDKEYQVIDIRHERGTLQVGFLSYAKLQLFDKMFFLLKNMARTSTKRLFQNQLIKSLYSEY